MSVSTSFDAQESHYVAIPVRLFFTQAQMHI